MYRELEDTGTPLAHEDIASLERMLGAPLPTDYAAFLRRYNGGSPTPNTVPIQDWPEGGIEDEVRMFYRLGSAPREDTYDLRWNFECYAGRIPLGLLPIADTGGGDQFCLWLVDDERGAVVLWDHEAEHHPPSHGNLHRVAPTFAAFLELLGDPCDDGPLPQAVLISSNEHPTLAEPVKPSLVQAHRRRPAR